MIVLGYYYSVCFIYCLMMSIRKWKMDVRAGGLGVTPGLDTLVLLAMCWVLAPVDLTLRWIRIYSEAEEARRRQIDNEKKVF